MARTGGVSGEPGAGFFKTTVTCLLLQIVSEDASCKKENVFVGASTVDTSAVAP